MEFPISNLFTPVINPWMNDLFRLDANRYIFIWKDDIVFSDINKKYGARCISSEENSGSYIVTLINKIFNYFS